MNNFLNSTNNNQTTTIMYFSKLFWQELFGNYLILDYLYLYLLAPLGFSALILNLFCLRVFFRNEFKKKQIYSYLRAYLVSGSVVCLMLATNFLIRTPNILEFTNSKAARTFGLFFGFPVVVTFYFYSSLLDIYISLERVAQFLTNLTIIKRYKPVFVNVLLFILSVITNSVYYFTYVPGEYEAPLDAKNTKYKIYFTDLSAFGRTQYGQINVFAVYILRDVLTLFVCISLSIFSLVLVKRYVEHKKKTTQSKKVKKINTRVTYMVILMLTISIFEHTIFIFTYIYSFLSNNKYMSNIFNIITLASICVKQLSNAFIFFGFNKLFRKVVVSYFNNRQPSRFHSSSNQT